MSENRLYQLDRLAASGFAVTNETKIVGLSATPANGAARLLGAELAMSGVSVSKLKALEIFNPISHGAINIGTSSLYLRTSGGLAMPGWNARGDGTQNGNVQGHGDGTKTDNLTYQPNEGIPIHVSESKLLQWNDVSSERIVYQCEHRCYCLCYF